MMRAANGVALAREGVQAADAPLEVASFVQTGRPRPRSGTRPGPAPDGRGSRGGTWPRPTGPVPAEEENSGVDMPQEDRRATSSGVGTRLCVGSRDRTRKRRPPPSGRTPPRSARRRPSVMARRSTASPLPRWSARARRRREEALEDPLRVLRRHPGARVGHLDHLASPLRPAPGRSPARPRCVGAGVCAQVATAWRRRTSSPSSATAPSVTSSIGRSGSTPAGAHSSPTSASGPRGRRSRGGPRSAGQQQQVVHRRPCRPPRPRCAHRGSSGRRVAARRARGTARVTRAPR